MRSEVVMVTLKLIMITTNLDWPLTQNIWLYCMSQIFEIFLFLRCL